MTPPLRLSAVTELYEALKDVLYVMDSSYGVVGYHLNGEEAPWHEDEPDGLGGLMDKVRAAISAAEAPAEGNPSAQNAGAHSQTYRTLAGAGSAGDNGRAGPATTDMHEENWGEDEVCDETEV
jgi:hypothetical protein